MGGNMSAKKHALSLIVLFALIVITFWFLLKDIGFKGVWLALKQANGWYLLLGLGMVIIYFLGEGEAIRAICSSLGSKVKRTRGFVYACIDFYFSAITPSATGGQPVALYYMGKDNIPFTTSGLALLLHTVIFKVILLILGVWCLIVKWPLFAGGNWAVRILFTAGVIINVVVVALCLMAMFSQRAIRKMVRVFVNLGARIRLVKNPEERITHIFRSVDEYANGANYIRTHPFLVFRVFIITFVQRIALFSVAYWVYRALGLGAYTLYDMIALQTLIAMAIDSLPLPGGMGASEGVFTMLYRTVYSTQMLVPALILTRGVNYYCALLLSSVCVIVNQIKLVRRK